MVGRWSTHSMELMLRPCRNCMVLLTQEQTNPSIYSAITLRSPTRNMQSSVNEAIDPSVWSALARSATALLERLQRHSAQASKSRGLQAQ